MLGRAVASPGHRAFCVPVCLPDCLSVCLKKCLKKCLKTPTRRSVCATLAPLERLALARSSCFGSIYQEHILASNLGRSRGDQRPKVTSNRVDSPKTLHLIMVTRFPAAPCEVNSLIALPLVGCGLLKDVCCNLWRRSDGTGGLVSTAAAAGCCCWTGWHCS